MSPELTKAFEFAQDSTKQLITLATAVVTFSVAFLKDFAGGTAQPGRDLLTWAWILFFASVCFGMWTLLRLTGEVSKTSGWSLFDWGIRLPSFLQVVTFGLGLLLTLVFGASAQPAPATGA